MSSPTQRSKKLMEEAGYLVEIVERWNPWAHIRQDLYGIVDLLGVGPAGTLAVQTTTAAHVAERREKILASKAIPYLVAAGWTVRIHGWRKPSKRFRRWRVSEVDILVNGRIIQADVTEAHETGDEE